MLLNCSVREDAWESLGLQEDKPGDPKGNQSWIFIERNDAEAETPILWPLNAKKWLIGKLPDAGKDWRQEKGITEDKIVGWHHPLNGHVFEQAPGIGDGQGSLACCSPWGRKESDTTEPLTDLLTESIMFTSSYSFLNILLYFTLKIKTCSKYYLLLLIVWHFNTSFCYFKSNVSMFLYPKMLTDVFPSEFLLCPQYLSPKLKWFKRLWQVA